MKSTSKKGRRRKSGDNVRNGSGDPDEEENIADDAEDDPGAASGKETRFDDGSESDSEVDESDDARAQPSSTSVLITPRCKHQRPSASIWTKITDNVLTSGVAKGFRFLKWVALNASTALGGVILILLLAYVFPSIAFEQN